MNSQAASHYSRSNTKRHETDGGSQAASRGNAGGSQAARNSERTGRPGVKTLLRTAAFKNQDEVRHPPGGGRGG